MIEDYICLDLETTGLNPKTDKIIEIGAVKVRNGNIVGSFETFVAPERKLEQRITELTGITDEMLQNAAFAAAEAENPGHTRFGRVASGDQFICSQEQKDTIIANTGAICAEMEGAAIAHTAYRNGIPFVVLRAISDKADGSAEMDYPTFETMAAHRCAQVTMHLARSLKG